MLGGNTMDSSRTSSTISSKDMAIDPPFRIPALRFFAVLPCTFRHPCAVSYRVETKSFGQPNSNLEWPWTPDCDTGEIPS